MKMKYGQLNFKIRPVIGNHLPSLNHNFVRLSSITVLFVALHNGTSQSLDKGIVLPFLKNKLDGMFTVCCHVCKYYNGSSSYKLVYQT